IGRAVAEPGAERVDRLRRPLGLHLDAAVEGVADPPREPQAPRLVRGRGAEPDPLDPPADDHPDTLHGAHRRPTKVGRGARGQDAPRALPPRAPPGPPPPAAAPRPPAVRRRRWRAPGSSRRRARPGPAATYRRSSGPADPRGRRR